MAKDRKSYKRVLLKLSGEVFGGEKGIGVDPDVVHDVALQIADDPHSAAGGRAPSPRNERPEIITITRMKSLRA